MWVQRNGDETHDGKVVGALALIAMHAVHLTDVAFVALCVRDERGGTLHDIGSHEAAVRLLQVQDDSHEGPGVDARRRSAPVGVADLSGHPAGAWAEFREAAEHSGIASVLSQPLLLEGELSGNVDLYDSSVRSWTPSDMQAASAIAQLATIVIDQASEVDRSRTAAERLRVALESRAVIEQAKGMIALDHAIPVETAFSWLRLHSRNTNTPVRELASAVVELRLQIPAPATQTSHERLASDRHVGRRTG